MYPRTSSLQPVSVGRFVCEEALEHKGVSLDLDATQLDGGQAQHDGLPGEQAGKARGRAELQGGVDGFEGGQAFDEGPGGEVYQAGLGTWRQNLDKIKSAAEGVRKLISGYYC